jgi:hypothetical protein
MGLLRGTRNLLEKHLGRRRKKKKIIKTKLLGIYKCICKYKELKRKMTQAPSTTAHNPQNFFHFIPSRRGKKAPSST